MPEILGQVTDAQWWDMHSMYNGNELGLYFAYPEIQLAIIEYDTQLAEQAKVIPVESIPGGKPMQTEHLEWHHVIGTKDFDQILVNDYMIVFGGLAAAYDNLTNPRALTLNVAHEALRSTTCITDEAQRELLMKTLDSKRADYHRIRRLAGMGYSPELTS